MNFLLLLVAAATVIGEGKGRQTPEVCYSQECEEIGKQIFKFMDEDEEKCEDFYKFSCGGFLKNNEFRSDLTNTFLLRQTQGRLFKQMLSIFEEVPDHSQNLYRLLKNMYNLCKDKEKINKAGIDPIKQKINDGGNWPILNENWKSEGWKFEDVEIRLKREGFRYGGLIQVRIVLDHHNPQRYVLQVLPGQLWMDRGDLQGNNDKYDLTKAKMIEIAKRLGANEDRAHNQMGEALNFERELAQIMQVSYDDGQGKQMTLRELSQEVHWVDWMKLIQGLMPDGIEPADEDTVYVIDIKYLKDLERLIENHEMEAANVMFWQAIRELVQSEAFPGAIPARDNVNELCAITTYQRLPVAFSYFYVKKYLTEEARLEARKIVVRIQKELYHDIERLKWMDDDTKEEAENKLNALKLIVGYPDELSEVQKVEKAHQGLTIDQNHYALAILAWNRWFGDRSFKMLRKPAAETKYWVSDSFRMEGTYNIFDNTLTIPAGLLQPPYFNRKVPNYVNYAILGRIVGEHMAEGIINQGTNYDSKGSYKEEGWWSSFTKTEFEFRQSCFVQEYKHYKSITGKHLDSGWTVYNNMADQGAVKLAYNAYKKNFPNEDIKLPNVPGTYSTNQLFWMVGAHIWCAKISEDAVKYLKDNQREAPPDLRVNAAYGTMKEFGEDFHCNYERLYEKKDSDQGDKKDGKEAEPEQRKDEDESANSEPNGEDLPTQNPLYPKTRCQLW